MKLDKVRNITEEYRCFLDKENFDLDEWVNSLNEKQMDNFLKLNIPKTLFKKLFYVIINLDMLNLNDYVARIKCLSNLNLKTEICNWDVINYLESGFLYSDNLFADVKILKDYPINNLCYLFRKKDFIDSKYHIEDLKLIMKCIEEGKLNKIDYLVILASNKDSINSKYHKVDMKLLATSNADSNRLIDNIHDTSSLSEIERYNLCLLSNVKSPLSILTELAINKFSLNDSYHYSNMCLLTRNKECNSILYKLMSNPDNINSKYYKEEIEIISKCKNYHQALNLYYYINPDIYYLKAKYQNLRMWYNLEYPTFTSGRVDPNYLENLNFLLNVKVDYIEYYVMLFLNPKFMNSKYKDIDLEILKKVEGTNNFIYLFKIMFNNYFMESEHHIQDLEILTNINLSKKINYCEYEFCLLPFINDIIIDKACVIASNPNYIYHEFDMKYLYELSKLPNLSHDELKVFEDIIKFGNGRKLVKDYCEKLIDLLDFKKQNKEDCSRKFLNGLNDLYDEISQLQNTKNKEEKKHILKLFKF